MSFKIATITMGMLGAMAQQTIDAKCVYPGTCTHPETDYNLSSPVTPRRMWDQDGTFSGANSIQSIGMSWGAYASQDHVRRATPKAGGGEHGNPGDGYEICPQNIQAGLDALWFTNDSFHELDAAEPQITAYLGWIKNNLSQGWPIVSFVLMKGFDKNPFRQILGHYDHVVPIWGLFSNHDLRDPAVYEDDYIVMGSNYGEDGNDNFGYVRTLNKMVDTLEMKNNCMHAQKDVEKSEAFVCFDQQLDYGVAIKGLRDPENVLQRVHLDSPILAEPDVRSGATAVNMDFTINISGLTVGKKYEMKKFLYTEWPHDSKFAEAKTTAANTITFVAQESFRSFHENIMGNGPTLSSSSAYFAVWNIDLYDPRPTIDMM